MTTGVRGHHIVPFTPMAQWSNTVSETHENVVSDPDTIQTSDDCAEGKKKASSKSQHDDKH